MDGGGGVDGGEGGFVAISDEMNKNRMYQKKIISGLIRKLIRTSVHCLYLMLSFFAIELFSRIRRTLKSWCKLKDHLLSFLSNMLLHVP